MLRRAGLPRRRPEGRSGARGGATLLLGSGLMSPPEPTLDPTSLEALWGEFHRELLSFARGKLNSRCDAEDVLQTAFLRAHGQLEAGARPQNPRAWLYRIVRNLVIDTHRQRARRPLESSGADLAPDSLGLEEPALSEIEEDCHLLMAQALPLFIERMASPYREALLLTEIEQLTQAEAAAREGISLSGMKSRVQRGRRQLREALDQCCEFGLDARNRIIECAPRSGLAESCRNRN
ncbi:MAG: sigma-70 family RNA polymerase sigma factor [Acidobacteriota bacterium]